MLDANVLVRFHKCDALPLLARAWPLHVSGHVKSELFKDGPGARARFSELRPVRHSVLPGSREWDHLCLLRRQFSPRDLGEDECIAICLAEAERGRFLPLVTFDGTGARESRSRGIVTLGFLDLLACLVVSRALSEEQADAIEAASIGKDGWKRPLGYDGRIGPRVELTLGRMRTEMEQWRQRTASTRRVPTQKR